MGVNVRIRRKKNPPFQQNRYLPQGGSIMFRIDLNPKYYTDKKLNTNASIAKRENTPLLMMNISEDR